MSNKNQHRPCVLTIAATDSAGMAGIGMDIRTQTALGCHTFKCHFSQYSTKQRKSIECQCRQ